MATDYPTHLSVVQSDEVTRRQPIPGESEFELEKSSQQTFAIKGFSRMKPKKSVLQVRRALQNAVRLLGGCCSIVWRRLQRRSQHEWIWKGGPPSHCSFQGLCFPFTSFNLFFHRGFTLLCVVLVSCMLFLPVLHQFV